MSVNQGKISYSAAVLMSINIMVGAGILYAVGPMTASVGNVSFLGWPLIALLLCPIVWSLIQAAKLFPGEGGFYHYCASGIHPLAGCVAHWGYLLGYLGTAASVSTVLRNGMATNLGLGFIQEHPIVFNVIIASFYTLINTISLSKISKVQSIATLLKLTPILTVVAIMAFYFKSDMSVDMSGLGGLGATVSTVIFAYWGVEACCNIGGLLKDGPQKVGSVILVGFIVTVALYSLFHLGLLYIMGADNLATYGAVAFPRFLGLSPVWASALEFGILGAILFSWANSILGVTLSNITSIHFMARKRMILGDKLLSKTNKNDRPIYVAMLHGVILFAFITLISDVNVLFALTNFGVLTAFILTLFALFNIYLKQGQFLHLAMTCVTFAVCAGLVYFSWTKIPNAIYLLPLILGISGGVFMYKIQEMRQTRESIGSESIMESA